MSRRRGQPIGTLLNHFPAKTFTTADTHTHTDKV